MVVGILTLIGMVINHGKEILPCVLIEGNEISIESIPVFQSRSIE